MESNGLGARMRVFQVAVGAGPERVVRFPRRSSVLNKLRDGSASDDCDDVPLETLATVLDRSGGADLLKLDCEGEEEAILKSAPAAALARTAEIRLEYHNGRSKQVIGLLRERHFDLTHFWAADARGGLAWFARRGSRTAE